MEEEEEEEVSMRCVLLLAFVFSVFLFSLEEIRSLKRVTCRRALSLSVFFSSDAQTKDNDREEKEEREENRERKRIHSTRSAISLSLSLSFTFNATSLPSNRIRILRENAKKRRHTTEAMTPTAGEKRKSKKKARARALEFFTMRIAYLRQTGFYGKVAFFYVRVSTHFVSRSVFFSSLARSSCGVIKSAFFFTSTSSFFSFLFFW